MLRSMRRLSLLDPASAAVRAVETAHSITFFVLDPPIVVDRELIEQMRTLSAQKRGMSVRICLHSSSEDKQHDMIILKTRGTYFPPHRHPEKTETVQVLQGELALVRYDANGNALDGNILKAGDLVRLTSEDYYFGAPVSEDVIYHESKPGPFIRGTDHVVPPWAPLPSDEEGAHKFTSDTIGSLR